MSNLDALMDEETSRRSSALAGSLNQAVGTNPDDFNAKRRVASYLGYAVDVVEGLPGLMDEAKVRKVQADAAGAPRLQERYTDADFAKLAHDDSGILSTLENSFRRGWPGMRQNAAATALRSNASSAADLDLIETKLARGERVLDAQDPAGVQYMTPQQRQRYRADIARAAGGNAATIANAQAEKAALPSPPVVRKVMQADGFRAAISAFMEAPAQFVASIGPESLVQNAPGLLAAAVMPGGAAAKAAAMGAGSFSTDYGSSLLDALAGQGVDLSDPAALKAAAANPTVMQRAASQAMAHASIVGTVDGLSGGIARKMALPAKVLSKAPAGRELANLAVQTPVQGIAGGIGEAGGQLAAGQPLSAGNIVAEVVGEAFTAPAEIASIAGGRVRERMADAQHAKEQAAIVAQLIDAAKASKLRERDPATFAAFAAEATDGAELFVDAKTFAQTVPPDVLAKLPAQITEQLAEAATAGGDVEFSMGDYAAYLADVPALAQHVRADANAMSPAEAEAYVADDHLAEELNALQPQTTTLDTTAEAVAQARDGINESLRLAGRFTPQVNAKYADLMGAFLGTMAERQGLTPDQIRGMVPRIVSQLESTRRTLDQGDDRLGAFDPDTKTIGLFERANLTSFLHEGGHFFLDAVAELAAGANTSAPLAADVQTLMDWFGVKDLATWRGMTLDEQRASHETFARGFERYLMEGKAPSAELSSMFARFRGWLMAVYRKFAALNVELTPEVRAVMDRMLASDAQIAETKARSNLRPLFDSATGAGMTADEFTAYQAHGQQATEDAVSALQSASIRDLQVIANAKARATRKLNAEARAARAGIEAEVTAEVYGLPIYAAWRDLARGHTDSGQAVRLSLDDLKQNHPELVGRIPHGMAANTEAALPADIVADGYGLSSGDELLKLLATLDKPAVVIEGRTDQLMLERHGELVDERAVETAAHAAIANDARTRVLATEHNALARAVGAQPVLARAAREYAAAAVARRKVRELKPGRIAAAEARAGREAADAFKKGDIATAAAAKRGQLLQSTLGRATHTALADVGRAVDYLSRFDSAAVRKAVGPDYADQIDQLLERVDLRVSESLRDIDKRKSLAAWVAQQEELGFSPVIDERLLAEAGRRSYKDMTVEELRGLVDTVKNIEHLGRLKQRLLTARDARTFDATVAELSASIIEHGGDRKPVALEGEKGIVPWLQGVAASHRKISSLAHQMDGGRDNGPVWSALVRPMNEASTREQVMIEEATVKLAELYTPMHALKGGLTGGKLFIPEIGDSLTRGGRLAVALNWGNEGNRQRLMDGDHWSAAQVLAVLRTLSPAELHFVNEVHAYVDSFWPQIQAQQLRVSGVSEERVEATPWTATASDGTQVSMVGGYFPVKYDPARSAKAESHEAAQVAKDMMQGAYVRATTRRGFTKARSDEVKDRPLRKDLSVLTQHVAEVTHNLAWQEWLVDANRLLGSKGIDGAIRAHYGPAVVRTLKDDLQGIATADVVAGTAIDQALLYLRSNVSRATMGLSFTTALMQPFGLLQSMARIGAAPVLRGMARWAGDAARMESSLIWIREKSDFMRLRAKTFNRELTEISGRVQGKSKAAQVFDAGLFYMMTKAQQIADVPTWIGRYEQALAQGLDESTAVAQADQAVLSSQGGGQTKDLAEVQRKHPMLTQFYSYFSVTLNLTVEKTAATDFQNPHAVAGWLADMALLSVVPAIAPAALAGLLRGDADEPDKWLKRLAQWQASYLMGLVVGVRELSGAVSGYSYSGPPVGRLVTDIGKAGQQLQQGEVDDPAVMAIVRLLGSAFGIPTVQALRSYKGWQAWSEGDAPVSAVLFGPPAHD